MARPRRLPSRRWYDAAKSGKALLRARAPPVYRALYNFSTRTREARLWRRIGRAPLAYGELTRPSKHMARQRLLREQARRHGAAVFVETGTFMGDMVHGLRGDFRRLVTIEVDPRLAEGARRRFASDPRVEVREGDSADVLPQVLAGLHERALFWLDGHDSGGITARGKGATPILVELEAILTHLVRDHVVLVDDAWWYDGNDGKPTIGDLRALAARLRPDLDFSVAFDIVHILPHPR